MKTHSALARLCLASLPAFALTLGAADNERRENPDRPPEQREERGGRREPRPEAQAAPRERERGEPHPEAGSPRRPGGESREGQRRSPEGERPPHAPRPEAGVRPPMAGRHEGGNPQARQEHIHQAIEHLRLAGLSDVAEHLQQNLSHAGGPPMASREHGREPAAGRPSIQPPRGEGPQSRNFAPPMAAQPNELRELREQVEQLKRMVDELARQRR